MESEILMVREEDGYRVLHGHLHLTALMSANAEIVIYLRGTGNVTLTRTTKGIIVNDGEVSLPLLRT